MNGSQESLTCEDAPIVNPIISTDPEELRRQKKNEGNARWYAANRERVCARVKKWSAENPEKVRENARKWKAAHQEKLREYSAKNYAANPEKHLVAVYKWRDSHKEQQREYNKAWRVANKERQSELAKIWKAEHPENVRKTIKKWQDANREFLYEKNRIWHATHPEQARERRKKWRTAHPENEKIHKHTRRTRISEAGGSFTVNDIQSMLKQQKGKCIVCLTSIKKKYHIDHIIPVSKGGSSDRGNLQLLCPRCNLSKNNKDNIIFMQQNGFLL